jgi:hypothetical protein
MRNTPRLLSAAAVLGLAAVGCSSPSPAQPEPVAPDFQVSPLGVSRVAVEVSPDARPHVVAHVFGAFPDSCGSINSTRQIRYQNIVTATVLGQRPTHGICAAVITPVQVDLVLEGMFFSGDYVVTVNGVTAAFSVP